MNHALKTTIIGTALLGIAALSSASTAQAATTYDAYGWTCYTENSSGSTNCKAIASVFCSRQGLGAAAGYRLGYVSSENVGHFRWISCHG